MGNRVGKKKTVLDEHLENEKTKESSIRKVLFLGAGGSGKSTLLRQLESKHGIIDREKLKAEYLPTIDCSLLASMHTLCSNIEDFKDEDTNAARAHVLELGSGIDKRIDLSSANFRVLLCQLATDLELLWKQSEIQAAYAERVKFRKKGQPIDESTAYLMQPDVFERVSREDYSPTINDILRIRIKTTGIIEKNLKTGDTTYRVFDVGGQKNERKKWIHCFEDVTAVVYVADLTAYDNVLDEDVTMNALEDDLVLWEEIAESRWFQKSDIFLFLNKQDLFLERLKTAPLSQSIVRLWAPLAESPVTEPSATAITTAVSTSESTTHETKSASAIDPSGMRYSQLRVPRDGAPIGAQMDFVLGLYMARLSSATTRVTARFTTATSPEVVDHVWDSVTSQVDVRQNKTRKYSEMESMALMFEATSGRDGYELYTPRPDTVTLVRAADTNADKPSDASTPAHPALTRELCLNMLKRESASRLSNQTLEAYNAAIRQGDKVNIVTERVQTAVVNSFGFKGESEALGLDFLRGAQYLFPNDAEIVSIPFYVKHNKISQGLPVGSTIPRDLTLYSAGEGAPTATTLSDYHQQVGSEKPLVVVAGSIS